MVLVEEFSVTVVPLFVTHYHRADQPPFQNLSDLDGQRLVGVLADLDSAEVRQRSSRRFGPRYMALRRATEARARQLFIDRGGAPVRTAPHYFVLGSSSWFAGLYRDPAQVLLPLSELPSAVTSATWGDSVSALGLGVPLGLPAPDPAHADRVYRLDELSALVAEHGLPTGRTPESASGYTGHQRTLVDTYIEVQLWADDPVDRFLHQQRSDHHI